MEHAHSSQSATVSKVWPLPVDHSHPVQVLHGRDKLPDVSAGFRLLQPLLLVYLVHQVAPRTQLHDQVVAVVRLQDVKELRNVGMADHLLDLPLSPKVFGDIGVFFGSLFVNDFYGHLRRYQEHGRCQTRKAKIIILTNHKNPRKIHSYFQHQEKNII